MLKLICPEKNCQSDRIVKNGSNKAGQPQYKCRVCGRSFTGNKIGRPSVGAKNPQAKSYSFTASVKLTKYLEACRKPRESDRALFTRLILNTKKGS